MNRQIAVLLAVASLASGCRKPMPSPDYIEASNRYTSLLAVQGDDAYASPAMTDVVAQLGRVTAKSSDHAAAVALIATIAAERARVADEQGKVARALAVPLPTPVFESFAPVPVPIEVEAAQAVDAGANDLARGGDFAALQAKYVGCLVARGTIAMIAADGKTSDTESYEVHDSASCRSRLSSFGANVLLVQGGKIAYLLPKSAVKMVTSLGDGGNLPAP